MAFRGREIDQRQLFLQQQRLLPRTLEDLLIGWISRLAGAAALLLCAGLWLSLLTWTATDPSLTYSSEGGTSNLLGWVGAAAADLLLQIFGLSAIIALICLTVWGVELIKSATVDRIQVRSFQGLLALLAISGGSSALPVSEAWSFHHGYGGIAGDVIYNFFAGLIAQFRISLFGFLAGMGLFTIGFWAFSCAVGLDRETLRQIAYRPRRGRNWLAGWRRKAERQDLEPTQFNSEEPPRPTVHRDFEPSLGPLPKGSWSETTAPNDSGHRLPLERNGNATPRHQTERGHTANIGMVDDLEIARRFAPANGPAGSPLQQTVIEVEETGFDDQVETVEPESAVQAPYIPPPNTRYRGPSLNELQHLATGHDQHDDGEALRAAGDHLVSVLADFRVKGEIKNIRPGPVVTLFEFEPARGIKSSRIIALADDVARSMSAPSARISVIPGRNVIGIEIPNQQRETVTLRELLETDAYRNCDAALPLALGKAIDGTTVVADLARMPHLLIAGTTGSGKSVGINAMIMSLLYRLSPADCRLLIIDPKMLELSSYNDIPHLLSPVITDPNAAVSALYWAVGEMEERYKRMTELGVRNIDAYNSRVRHAQRTGQPIRQTVQTGFDAVTGQPTFHERLFDVEPMPYIVVVVDEFADLMCVAGKEIEAAVQRLAQMARAAGIHLVMATQRPSVDVVTGTIKANFPTRIGFRVASKIDSRTIVNEQGAEQLLGHGDMLFAMAGLPMTRVHGPFVSDEEIEAVTASLKAQCRPDYIVGLADQAPAEPVPAQDPRQAAEQKLYEQAVDVVRRDNRASISHVQRQLSIGYNRAARLIDRMEELGVVSPPNQSGKREVLASAPHAA